MKNDNIQRNDTSAIIFPVHGDTSEARRKKVNAVFANGRISPVLRQSRMNAPSDDSRSGKRSDEADTCLLQENTWNRRVQTSLEIASFPAVCASRSLRARRKGASFAKVLLDGCLPGVQRPQRSRPREKLHARGRVSRRHTDNFLDVAEILVDFVAANGKSVFTTIRRINPALPNKKGTNQ